MCADPCRALLYSQHYGAVFPLIERNRVGLRQVFSEHGLHLGGKAVAQNHRIDFVIKQEAAPVQIG